MTKQKTQTAVIVIPTYNEAENIDRMIEHLFTKTFKDIKAKKNKQAIMADKSFGS